MGLMFYNRIEADYLHKLDIFWLRKIGLLKGYCSSTDITWKQGDNESSISIEVNLVENLHEYLLGQELPKDGFVRLAYKAENQKYDYKAHLTTTDCNYGRFRYWFVCPTCSKRIGVVYLRGGVFACRSCQYLTYESRKLSGRWKQLGRIISIPEMKALRKDIKRKFYNGEPTRKLVRYLRAKNKMDKIYRYMGLMSHGS